LAAVASALASRRRCSSTWLPDRNCSMGTGSDAESGGTSSRAHQVGFVGLPFLGNPKP
jgi:hypothetical protein